MKETDKISRNIKNLKNSFLTIYTIFMVFVFKFRLTQFLENGLFVLRNDGRQRASHCQNILLRICARNVRSLCTLSDALHL